ncbi:MAG: twin-arginine translocase TatA/TatE family subunit [Bacteroidetes bacterium]|nr:twin-arginine translocase TatA/TatE family subunit [Bacteroidota bacterium]
MTLGILLIFGLGTQEIIFIALIILLLFGGSKIPELMKGIGKGVKSFKEGMSGIEDDLKSDPKKDQAETKPEEKK